MKELQPIKQPGMVVPVVLTAFLLAIGLSPRFARGEVGEAGRSISGHNAVPAPGESARPAQLEPGRSRGLELTEAVHQAVEWHPNIAESVGKLQQQTQQVRAAKAGYYPQVSVGVLSGYDRSLNNNDDSFGVGENQELNLSASQMLYDFGKVSNSVRAANAGVDRNHAEVLLAIDQVARNTAHAAIEVQRYQATLDIAREQVRGVSAIADLARKRSAKGASTRSDVLQAQSRIEAARATEQRVRAQLGRWRSILQSLMGSAEPTLVSSGFPESLAKGCSGAEVELDSVPGVLMADAVHAEADALIDLSRAESLPTLSLDGDFNRYLDDRHRNPGATLADESDYTVFFNVSMPLYQGGAAAARREAAGYALRAAGAARDAALLSARRGLREAREQSRGLSQNLVTLGLRERSIAETRDLYRQQYLSLGSRTLLDLLNAEQELHRARIERNNSRHDLRRLQVDCLYAAGGLRKALQLNKPVVQGVEVQP